MMANKVLYDNNCPLKTMSSACRVSITAGKTMTKKIPTWLDYGLVSPRSTSTLRLTTTNVGLSPRLANDRVMHTAHED